MAGLVNVWASLAAAGLRLDYKEKEVAVLCRRHHYSTRPREPKPTPRLSSSRQGEAP